MASTNDNGSVYNPEIGNEDVLIYDIETATAGPKPDAEKDHLKIFGFYSYKTKKVGLIPYWDKKAIQQVIDAHKFLVGFNNEKYDDPILKREGISLEYKRIIDLRSIIKMRAPGMVTHKGMLGNVLMKYSLDYITRFLELVDEDSAKEEIDYAVFKKERWSAEEVAEIKKYTERDIFVTKRLYEWVDEYFDGFTDFIPAEDAKKKYHLTDTIAKFAYKAICYAMGWQPTYNRGFDKLTEEERISGGYVAYPAGDRFEGDIYCIDFNSLYPHIMILCNLYGRNKNSADGWNGGGKWDVEGFYDANKESGVGKLLYAWYHLRLFYKRQFLLEDGKVVKMFDSKKGYSAADYIGQKYYKVGHKDDGHIQLDLVEMTAEDADEYIRLGKLGKDRREYTVKIIINTIYGILNNPYYELVYDIIAGGDCTRLGRQWTKYARKVFRDAGYKILYTDTDSWYVLDVFSDKVKLMATIKQVVDDILNSVPFPKPTFDAGIDDEIKYMFFFKGTKKDEKSQDEMDEDDFINRPKGYMKKNYIYVTKEGGLTIKNLGIKKKNISAVSKEIFWSHMVPQIKAKGKIKYDRTEIDNLMRKMLTDNIELAYMRKEVGPMAQYVKSTTSMPAQISQRYGAGIHFLIPNIRNIGVGKEMKYCSDEEFKQYKMDLSDIDFTNFWKELNYFIKEKKTLDLREMLG
jgi:hypothetical protein